MAQEGRGKRKQERRLEDEKIRGSEVQKIRR